MTLLTRFRIWLSDLLEPRPKSLPAHGENRPATIEQAAKELVERARQGDQNAMATIRMVAINTNKGDPKAKRTFVALHQYIERNPPLGSVTESLANDPTKLDGLVEKIQAAFAGEEYEQVIFKKLPFLASKSVPKAVVTVANGPIIQDKLDAINGMFTGNDQKAFQLGYKHGVKELNRIPEAHRPAFVLGHIIGTAHKLQIIRQPNSKLSILSPQLGMEFGEC